MKIRINWMLLGIGLLLGNTGSAAIVDGVLITDNTLYHSQSLVDQANAIEINTTQRGTWNPLQGHGIWNYTKDLSGKTYVHITTKGMQADGIRENNGAQRLILGDHVEIRTSGFSADAINVAEEANGSIVVSGSYFVAESQSGMGIRVNNSITGTGVNKTQIGSDFAIHTKGSGDNEVEGSGYGVYAGLRNSKQDSLLSPIVEIFSTADSQVILGEDGSIQTNGQNAHAVYANRSGKIVIGSGIDLGVSGSNAYGITADSLNKDIAGDTTVTLLGNTKIEASDIAKGQLAIYAKGSGLNKGIISNVDSDGTLNDFNRKDFLGNDLSISDQRVFLVNGDFRANSNGLIHLDMTDGTQIIGKTELSGTGKIDFKIAGSGSVWKMTGNSTLTNLALADGATVYLGGVDDNAVTEHTLTINGNYTGQNGRFIFNGTLNGDSNSPIDQILIKGDAGGTTKIGVNNIGGLGEKTVNGIKIITVEGNNTNGNQTFTNDGRIVSGAYDYFVTKGNEQGGDSNNWYLTNRLPEVIEIPEEPDIDPEPEPDVEPEPGPGRGPAIVRPEGGAYLGNALAANHLFQLSLHDRVGEVGAGSWDSLEQSRKKENVWVRADKRKSFIKEKSGQIELNQDYDVIQVGVDLLRKQKDSRTYILGVMGGYGDAKTNSQGLLYHAEGRIHGYSIGVYGTLYDEHRDQSGKYLDGWILWNTFDGQVTGDGLNTEKYDLDGWTASIEGGYDQLLKKHQTNPNHNLWLKWQGQITYQGVRADGHRESNGTYVGKNDTNIQTRVGARLYKKMRSEGGLWSQSFAELNWYYNTSTYDVSMDGDYDFSTRGARNVGELKIGYEGQVNRNLQLWGHVFGAVGSHSHYSYGLRVGAKYTF